MTGTHTDTFQKSKFIITISAPFKIISFNDSNTPNNKVACAQLSL